MSSSNGSTIPKQVTSSIPNAGICTKWSSAKPAYKPINFEMPSRKQKLSTDDQPKTEKVLLSAGEMPKPKQKSTPSSSKVGIGGQYDIVPANRNRQGIASSQSKVVTSGMTRSPNVPPRIIDVQATIRTSSQDRSSKEENPKSTSKVPRQLRSTPVVTTLSQGWKSTPSRASNPFETTKAENRKYADCSTVSSGKPNAHKDNGAQSKTEKQPRSDGLQVPESVRPKRQPRLNLTSPTSHDGTGGSVIWNADRTRRGIAAPQPASTALGGAQSLRTPVEIPDIPAPLVDSRGENQKHLNEFQNQLPPKPVTNALANDYQRSPTSMLLQSDMDNNRKYMNSLTLPRSKPVVSIRKGFNDAQDSLIRSGTVMELTNNDTIMPTALQRLLGPESRSQNSEIVCDLARLRNAPEPPEGMLTDGRQWYTQSRRAVQPVIFDPEPIIELNSLGSSLLSNGHHVYRGDEIMNEKAILDLVNKVDIQANSLWTMSLDYYDPTIELTSDFLKTLIQPMAKRSISESSTGGAVRELAQQFEGLSSSCVKARSFSKHLSTYDFTSVPSSPSLYKRQTSYNPSFNSLTTVRPTKLEVDEDKTESERSSFESTELPMYFGRKELIMSPNKWNPQQPSENVYPSQHRPTEQRGSFAQVYGTLRKSPGTLPLVPENRLIEPNHVEKNRSNYSPWKNVASYRDNEEKSSDGTYRTLPRGFGGRNGQATRLQHLFDPKWGLQGNTTTVRRRDPNLIDTTRPRLLFPQPGER